MVEAESNTSETGPSFSETLEGEDVPSIKSSLPIDIHHPLIQGALSVVMCFVLFIFSFIWRSCTDALTLVRFLNKPPPGRTSPEALCINAPDAPQPAPDAPQPAASSPRRCARFQPEQTCTRPELQVPDLAFHPRHNSTSIFNVRNHTNHSIVVEDSSFVFVPDVNSFIDANDVTSSLNFLTASSVHIIRFLFYILRFFPTFSKVSFLRDGPSALILRVRVGLNLRVEIPPELFELPSPPTVNDTVF
jgi:hypothetical protein